MRKLNWDDEETRQFAIKCLTAAWNVIYNSIHCLANLVSGLSLYYVSVAYLRHQAMWNIIPVKL
jgi:regulator of nonsense transcripts 2